MKDEYYVMKKKELDRFFKIKEFQCDKKCIYVCSELQKKACLDYYCMLAIGDKPLEEILI